MRKWEKGGDSNEKQPDQPIFTHQGYYPMTHYFNRKTSYLMLAVCLISFGSLQAQSSHDHAEHETTQLELDHGQLWPTDAPLREGMERVRDAVVVAQQADAQDRLDATQAQILVSAIEDSTAFMVQNCRLEPKADANLHILLGRLSVATTAVKANPKATNGLPKMLGVLDIYPHYFTHPDWQSVNQGH